MIQDKCRIFGIGSFARVISVLLLVLTWTCKYPKAAEAVDTLKIGVVLPLSGEGSTKALPIQNGIILAARHIHEAGGDHGLEIELISRDSHESVEGAVEAAQKLVSIDGVSCIIGPLTSDATMKVAVDVTVPDKVVQISPVSPIPELTGLDDEDFFFRTIPSDSRQGVVLAKVAHAQELRRIGVLYVNDLYGWGLSAVFREAFENQGGSIPSMIPFNIGQASYRTEIQKALGEKPEALLVIGYPADGIKILKKSVDLEPSVKFLLPGTMKDRQIIDKVGSDFLNGSYGTELAPAKNSITEKFASAYEEMFGVRPAYPQIDTGFDAAVLAALAAARGGGTDGETIRDNLRRVANPPGQKVDFTSLKKAFDLIMSGEDVDYEGVSGSVDLDKNGDVLGGSYRVWTIEDGRIKVVRIETLER